MSTALIIQARMTSTRLPGKVLEMIGGHTALAHLYHRAKKIRGIDRICCAVPIGDVNEPVAKHALDLGFEVFRGSEQDVLSRYYHSAKYLGCDTIFRLTSDCPFIDPAVATETLALFNQSPCDFACNNAPPTWAHGFDCEITSFKWLEKAYHEARTDYEREHVMPFIRQHPDIRLVNYANELKDQKHLRLTLDYPEDLLFFQEIAKHSSDPLEMDTKEILQILKVHSELLEINRKQAELHRPL